MISRLIVIGWTLFCGWGLLSGLGEVGQEINRGTLDPDNPFAQIGITLGVFGWFMIWAVVVVPTALIGLLFKRTGSKATTQDTRSQQSKSSGPSLALLVAIIALIVLVVSYVDDDSVPEVTEQEETIERVDVTHADSSDVTEGPSLDRTAVVRIQTLLNQLGYNAGAPDGVVGTKTRAAIRAFQLDAGDEQTGELSSELVVLLEGEARSRGIDITVRGSPERPARRSVSSNWKTRTETSPIDDSTNVHLWVRADSDIRGWLETYRPVLYFRCKEKSTNAFIVTGMSAHTDRIGDGATTYTNVTLRVDKLPAFTEEMSASTDDKALFFKHPKSFAKKLFGHDQLLFRFTPFNASPTLTTFQVTGLQEAIKQLREECGWPGTPTPQVPEEADPQKRLLSDKVLITRAQSELKSLGYYHGAVDGRYSGQLKEALETFQSARQLPVTGSPDLDTLNALVGPAVEGDAAKGRELFRKHLCFGCHKFETGKHGAGPSLAGVWGRRAGRAEGFNYSSALKKSRVIWDAETLKQWIADPKTLVPRTKMILAKPVRNDREQDDLIAYLKLASQQ